MKISLNRDELVRLVELCDKFDTQWLIVEHSDGSGIGYVLNANIPTKVNGESGMFTVEVTGVDTW